MRHVAVQAVCLWFGFAAHAEPKSAQLPVGRWQADSERLCIEVYRGGIIEISQQQEGDRHPARLAGLHRIRLVAAEEYEVTVDVSWILQKTLSNCRKYWYSQKLESRDVLGLTARPGKPLVLSFRFSDDQKRLELCGLPKRCLGLHRTTAYQTAPFLDVSAETQRADASDRPRETKPKDLPAGLD